MDHANHSANGVMFLGIKDTRDDPVAGRRMWDHDRFTVQAPNAVGAIGERGDVDGLL
jgi:hypothetical protein